MAFPRFVILGWVLLLLRGQDYLFMHIKSLRLSLLLMGSFISKDIVAGVFFKMFKESFMAAVISNRYYLLALVLQAIFCIVIYF